MKTTLRHLMAAAVMLGGLIAAVPGHADAVMYGSSNYCREYTQPLQINGRVRTGYGTACLQPDGSWAMVTEPSLSPSPVVVQAPPPPSYVVASAPAYVEPPLLVGGTIWVGDHHPRWHNRWHEGRWHHDNGWHGRRWE